MTAFFEKDNFSLSGPNFGKRNLLNDINFKWLVKAFMENYEDKSGGLQSIQQINTLNINSKNYLCKTNSSNLVIKIISNKNKSYFDRMDYISKSFKNKKISSPKILFNKNGQSFTKIGNKAIQISKFINGRYFLGGEGDIKKAASAINNFHKNSITLSFSNLSNLPSFPENGLEILELIIKDLNKHKQSLGIENSKLIYENKKFLIHNIKNFLSQDNLTHKAYPLHVDLHPHNILITNEEGFVVDLDSVHLVDPLTSIGFCFFKLIRQDIANKSYSEKSREIFLEIINNSDSDILFDPKEASFFIKKEVARRLLFILEENITNGFSKWNSVLKTQICGIHEIEFICKNEILN
tara:strand:+ start:122 stop:1177 length:1056 start_codon:yes stop_codon:yes gene_type:complete